MDVSELSLDQLGLTFGTDKASSTHDYLRFYERYFQPIRSRPITLLEVGVLDGASLAVWEAYFPAASIIGADINPATQRFARSRVAIEILDQSNLEQLVRLGRTRGPFDIVIEDGSHLWEHQITTLRTLFSFVQPGGIYIVEDLQTNYGAMEEHYRGVSSISCVEYLKKLVDLRVADDQIDIQKQEDAFLRSYGRAVNAITFYRRACLIEKAAFKLPESPGEPLVPLPAEMTMLPLVAHVGQLGDVCSRAGSIVPARDSQHIQGFTIEHAPGAAYLIEYRARLANGDWTDWCRPGSFVGTRGKSEDLTGFAVRLAGGTQRRFALEAVGRFAGSSQLVTVTDGMDCVPQAGMAALSAMQVILG